MHNSNSLICGALSWKIVGETFRQFCDYVIKNFRRLYEILSASLSREIIPANLELFPGSIRSQPQNYQGPNRSIEPSLYVRQSLYHTVPVVKILSGHVHVENADGQFADNLSNVNRLIDFLLFSFCRSE